MDLFCAERKGKMLHLLKKGTKPCTGGRKRKRFTVFGPEKVSTLVKRADEPMGGQSTQISGGFQDIT